jgi:hypothetical protein
MIFPSRSAVSFLTGTWVYIFFLFFLFSFFSLSAFSDENWAMYPTSSSLLPEQLMKMSSLSSFGFSRYFVCFLSIHSSSEIERETDVVLISSHSLSEWTYIKGEWAQSYMFV